MAEKNKDASNATPPTTGSARRRRLTYGLNVAVAVLAAVAVAGLLNALSYKFFWRADVTALRRHSLAPQTRKVLDALKGDYRLVTLMSTPDAMSFPEQAAAVREARDLVDEYARHGGRVSAQHLEPGRDLAQIEAFLTSLQDRYADELEPTRRAIERGRAAMENLRGETQAQIEVLRALVKAPALADETLRQSVTTVLQSLVRFDQQYDRIDEQVRTILADAMPDYASAQAAVEQVLREMKEKIIERAIVGFRAGAGKSDVDPAVKELLLQAAALLDRSLQAIGDGLSGLASSKAGAPQYEQLRSQLQSPAGGGVQSGVVVVGPKRVQVVPLAEMFRAPPANMVSAGERPERQFLGEERITGAMLSMSMDQPPLVVFVSSGTRMPALGPNGLFEHVAQRLRNLNFDVQPWNPSGQMTAFGQPMPAGPAPLPKEGQRAVYVILPQLEPPNPMNPTGMRDQEQVAKLLDDRLAAGDGALVMLSFDLGTRFGAANPVRDVVSKWGITPQLDRVVVREVTLPDRKTTTAAEFLVSDWATELSVTQALRGMPALFVQTSPLTISPSDPADAQGAAVERFPLVRLRERRMWATGDLEGEEPPRYDAASASDSFLVGAAARRGKAALVVIADPLWASDRVTTVSTVGMRGEDAVNVFGAQFPGNGELFVNSVYWLAGLDELIAASPRSQDIRRIEPLSEGVDQALRIALLAGLPGATLLAGVLVWLVRRRA